MPAMNQPTTTRAKWDFDRVFRLLITLVVAVGLFALVRYLSDVLIPLAAALLLAYLLSPVVDALETRLHRRWPAVMLTVAGCTVVLCAALLLLIVVGGQEISSLRDLVQQFAGRSARRVRRPLG